MCFSLPAWLGCLLSLSFEFEIFTFTEFNDVKTLAEYDFAPVESLMLNTGNTDDPGCLFLARNHQWKHCRAWNIARVYQ